MNSLLGRSFRRLSDEQCRQLHQASLKILERTGARLHHQPAVDLLRDAGAHVSEGNRVRIPPRLVERAFESVPREVVLFDRHGRPAMALGGQRTYFGTGSDCLNIVDHRSGERRKPLLQDVVAGVTLCDALPNIDFVMSMFLPTDVPDLVSDRYQMEVMLSRTVKPIIYVTNEFAGCQDAVAMAEAVVGGADALCRQPLAACYINVTTGLRHNEEALQKLLFLSERGLPAAYIPVALGGATARVALAGNMAIWNAGCLVGLVLSQLNRPGAPFITTGWGASALDMRTAVSPYVEPEKAFIAQELAHLYRLPMFALGGCSDSKLVDQQAGIEAALTLMTNMLAGSHLVHDIGYLESGLSGSLAQVVICDELIDWLRTALGPVEINDETLALDLIDEVGPDGHFIDTDHTLEHFRQRWYPALIERHDYQGWLEEGGQDLGRRAAARVDEILEAHRPEPLPDDVLARLREIVASALTTS
jgi:trimethylamine--corrinoid protein Co-methyltransferase